MPMTYFLISFLVSLAFTFVGMPLLLHLCKIRGLYDMPNDRKLHSNKIPRLGGVFFAPAMLLGLMAGMSAMLLWNAPACAACAAGGIPILAAVADSFISLIFTGYATIEIGHDTIAAQLIALSISVGIIWIHDLAGNRVPTE